MRERIQKAVLHSAVEPTEAQKKRFEAFLRKKYGQAVLLQWEQDAALENGFRLEFEQPQRAPTPGQSVVLYQGDVVLGGGIITRVEK